MADYVYTLVLVYVVLIFIQVIVSFIPRMPYNRFLSAFLGFVGGRGEPLPAAVAARVLPMVRLGPAALDLSPMVGTFVLLIVGGHRRGHHPGLRGDASRRAGRARWPRWPWWWRSTR